MITSKKQLAITNQKIQSLYDSIKKLEAKDGPLSKSAIIQTKSLIKGLKKEVEEYELLIEKGIDAIEINDLAEVMLLPIKYRIAKRMTRDAFAREVNFSERMIARYESEGYKNINGENFQKILSKLNLKILGKIKEA